GVDPTPPTIWEQIWNGIVSTVTAWIVSAIVLAINAFANLVKVFAQIGSWVADQFSQFADKVASAVQAAAKVIAQIADFAWQFIQAVLNTLFSPIISAINQWRQSQAETVLQSAAAGKPPANGSDVGQRAMAGQRADEFFQGVEAIEALLYAIPIGLAVIEILTTVTPVKLASTLMAKWIVKAILVTALASAVSAVFQTFVNNPLALLPVPFPNYDDFIFTAEDLALIFAMHRFLRPQYTFLFAFGQYGPKVVGTIAG